MKFMGVYCLLAAGAMALVSAVLRKRARKGVWRRRRQIRRNRCSMSIKEGKK
jgi:hypothetical protein